MTKYSTPVARVSPPAIISAWDAGCSHSIKARVEEDAKDWGSDPTGTVLTLVNKTGGVVFDMRLDALLKAIEQATGAEIEVTFK